MDYSQYYRKGETPQSELLEGQERNHAGGGAYVVSPLARLERFLVLGTEGGTYYQREKEISRECAKLVRECVKAEGVRAARRITHMWNSGRCSRPDPVMFALAMAQAEGDEAVQAHLEGSFRDTVRTGYQLFRFVHYANALRGWGRGLRRLVASWYDREPGELAYQLVKYQQREGWRHRDVLRLCHGAPSGERAQSLVRWAVRGAETEEPLVRAAQQALDPKTPTKEVTELIGAHALTHEMVAPEHKRHASVWRALMEQMPLGALLRNLGALGAHGVLGPGKWAANAWAAERLTKPGAIRRARVHPLQVLAAGRVYGQGYGVQGQNTWTTAPEVVTALDEAMSASFRAVEPTGKRYLLGVDVSGSMAAPSTLQCVSCFEAAIVMAMATVRSEQFCAPMAFADTFRRLPLTRATSLAEVAQMRFGFGATDCALPMLFALKHQVDVDVFVVYTDHETWAGEIHPVEALRKYRRERVPDAKLAVVALTPTKFSIADPADPGMLDLVGFDAGAPAVLAEFARGWA